MNNVWYDAEVYNGKGTKTEYGDGNEYYYGPENKRDCPCDTCPLFEQCLKNVQLAAQLVRGLKIGLKCRFLNIPLTR